MNKVHLRSDLLVFVPWSKRWGHEVPDWSQVWDWSIQCADCGFQLFSIPHSEMAHDRRSYGRDNKVSIGSIPYQYQIEVEVAYTHHFDHPGYVTAQCLIRHLHDT